MDVVMQVATNGIIKSCPPLNRYHSAVEPGITKSPSQLYVESPLYLYHSLNS
jgi:hypothetical protein